MKESQRKRPFGGWSNALAKPLPLVRSHYALLNLVIAGLLAIAVSGALCGLIAWRFGRGAIAGDTLSSEMTWWRCKQLVESHYGVIVDCFEPGCTQAEVKPEGSCRQAELIDHSQEIVAFRLAAIPAAGVVSMIYLFLDGRWRRRSGLKASSAFHYRLGFVVFGLAAMVLLGVAAAGGIQGTADGLGRWLSDGSVAAVFGGVYAWLILSSRRSDRQPQSASKKAASQAACSSEESHPSRR
jgi:hypothetical protein